MPNDKRAHAVCLYPKVCYGEIIPMIVWLDSEDETHFVVQRIVPDASGFLMKYEKLPKSEWTLSRDEVKEIQTISFSEVAEEDYP